MVETVFAILAVGSSLLIGAMLSRQRLQKWEAAAESCGLQVVKASAWARQVKALAGEVEVRIEAAGNKGQFVRIAVTAPVPPGFHNLVIRHELPIKFAREIEIGDPDFDSEFFIEGPVRLVSALLDEQMRGLLSRVNTECRPQLSFGELRAQMDDKKVIGVLPLFVEIGRRFAQPMDIPRRLAENVRQDSVPGVRLHNLLVLARELPRHPETIKALRAACSDPSPEIRLRAATILGHEGDVVLLKLAEKLEDDDVSAKAVSTLGRMLPPDRTRHILDHTLRRRQLQTARACLESLGRSGAAAVEKLAEVLEKEYGELAPVAAWALGETGSPAAEPPLIQALERDDTEVRVAAATALGRVGSAAAVLPLKEAAERSPFDLGLRRATRQAIAEIQSRVQGASPGQLSLAGAEAGQLSLAQAEAGQLSLASDPAGQLSLGGDEKPEPEL